MHKMSLDKITEFFKTSPKYLYKKGEYIIRAGDQPSGVYFIEEGFVKVSSLTLDGSENVHLILKNSEIFPREMIFDIPPENVSFEAMTAVTLRRKPKESFRELIDSDTDALREAFHLAGAFLEIFTDRIDNLELTYSYPKTIDRLLKLSKRFGKYNGNEVTFEAPITHSVLAASINMSRETVSRELEKLKRKGIITEERHFIVIKDYKKLNEEFENYFVNK